MKRQYKPEALLFSEGGGMFTRYCKTRQIAHKAMIELCKEEKIDKMIDINKIQTQRFWYCRDCGYYTGEEPICYECGKDFVSKGRQAFIYYFLN